MTTAVYDSWEDAADALATPEERAAWAASAAAAAGIAGAVSGASAPGFDATSPLSLSASAAEAAPLDVAAVAAAASERARSAAEAIAAAESIPVIDDVGDVLEDGFAKQFFTDSHALFVRYDDMRRSRYCKALYAMRSNPGNEALLMAYHLAVLDPPLQKDPCYQAELAELERRYIQNMRNLGHTDVYRPVWVAPPERKIMLSYETLTALGVTQKFCPKSDCEEPKCTFLHDSRNKVHRYNHHNFIICRAHGDDHADDWCGCHERNEQTIAKQDAAQLADTLRLQLLAPMVRRTFGPNAPVPHLVFDVVGGEDLKSLAERMKIWHEMGGPIGAVSGANAIAMPNLEDGEPILGASKGVTGAPVAAPTPAAPQPAPIAEPAPVAPQEPSTP